MSGRAAQINRKAQADVMRLGRLRAKSPEVADDIALAQLSAAVAYLQLYKGPLQTMKILDALADDQCNAAYAEMPEGKNGGR